MLPKQVHRLLFLFPVYGGVKGLLWVDAIQMFIYIGGAIVAGLFLLNPYISGGYEHFSSTALAAEKFDIINWGFDTSIKRFFAEPYTLICGILGGAFLLMASHGTDQLIVQRL
ncbi:hypothetical protein ACFLTH_13240 [Bacteroidota bacterium]